MAGVSALPAGRRRTELRKVIDTEPANLFADWVLSFGEHSAEAYAPVVPAANAAGNPIDFADAAIGAIATEHNYIRATRNMADFKGTSVKLLNPWS
jgi:predicted nucleic acid-binding protein